MRRRLLLSCAMATALAVPAAAQPIQNIVLRNSFNPVGAGARGLGMGGAFVGVADDGSAASFNPAGLAQLRRSELALVGFSDSLNTSAPNPDTGRAEEEGSVHRAPDFFGLAVPFEVGGRNLTVQVAYQRTIDLFGKGRAFTRDSVPFRELKISLPGRGTVAADIFPEQSGAFHTLSAAAGYQLTSRLSIGGSLNYWLAGWTAQGTVSTRISTIAAAPAKPVLVMSNDRTFKQKQSMRALSVNTGALLRYPRLSVGAVLRMPFVGGYDLDETGTQTVTEAGQSARQTPSTATMTSRLHWAQTAAAGLALRPVTGLTLAADYAHSGWSGVYLEGVPDGALLTPTDPLINGEQPPPSYSNRNFFDLADASQTSTPDTSEWRVGGEYLVSLPKLVVPVRAGLFRSHSPIRNLSTNESRETSGFTFGSGLNFSHFVFDVACERRRSDGIVGLQLRSGQATSAGSSVEKLRETRIVASVLYRFPQNDPVKRLLRSLFVGNDEGR